MRRLGPYFPPLAAAAVGIAALAAFAAAGWPGAPNSCIAADACFCEAFRAGLIKQPANTWSALAFLAAGLLIAREESRRRAAGSFKAGAYSAFVVLVGVGTAFFHASMKREEGALDYLSMYLLLSFVFAHGATRALRLAPRYFFPLQALALAPFAALNLAEAYDTPPIFAALVVIAVLAEAAAAWRRRDLARESGWMGWTLATFLAGFAVWFLSKDGGPLCAPSSLLQGHALWHILCAAATFYLYLYYASERPAES